MVVNRAAHDLQPISRREQPIVAQRAHRDVGEPGVVQDATDECLPHLAGCAGDEDRAFGVHVSFSHFFSSRRSTITAARITPPATTFCHSDLPTRLTALNVSCKI